MKLLEKEMNEVLKKSIKKYESEIKKHLHENVVDKSTKKFRCQGYCKVKAVNTKGHTFTRCKRYAEKNKKYCELHNHNNKKGMYIKRKILTNDK